MLKTLWNIYKAINDRIAGLFAPFARRFPRVARFLGILRQRRRPLFILFGIVLHIVGFVFSIEAVMQNRSEQGAVAWAISLNTVPIVAVPAWIAVGDSEIRTYKSTHSAGIAEVRPMAEKLIADLEEVDSPETTGHPTMKMLEQLASMPTFAGNHADLLINGEESYSAMLEAMGEAEDYILFQFFIFRDDHVGQQFRDVLVAKARAGVDVWVLLDGWGSSGLPGGYLQEMRDAGVNARFFMDFEEEPSKFQINFRNHRKLIVVDGDVAFTGGLNVGTEYLGHNPKLSPWRDTAMRVRGPVVKSMQVPFAEDWYWVTNEIPGGLDWTLDDDPFVGEMEMICLASGPSDPVETCSMFFLTAINNAEERVWIAAPYFVPDAKMVTALQMAALRGVDVRVLIPDEVDSWLVHYSSFSYLPELTETGVKIFRYDAGFMHQKVVLVDESITAIGTANFDNRSFRLNFEITGIVHDKEFNAAVEEMLEADFARSIPADAGDYEDKSYIFRLKSRLARLLAPVQ